MRYFFDTEFIEDGKIIDLVSIGIVAEDGREYYAINFDCDFSKADDWVRQNVIAHLPPSPRFPGFSAKHKEAIANGWKNKSRIRDEILAFLGGESLVQDPNIYRLRAGATKPEIWAYYADYDWVVFCQLFGRMIDLPKGFPMYCRDLKQEMDRLGIPREALPNIEGTEHNALDDARWNKTAFEALQKASQQAALLKHHESLSSAYE